ncbi:MAG: YebC/PmpR family DNA-binding transcriptional regulator, partial [Bacilli bacterium]|nr:YebC/PmpR family DNA-binding transcriptional regulator [Bacilli bacterium]
IEVQVTPSDLEKAKKALNDMGVPEFENAENTMLANEEIELQGEDLERFKKILDELDEAEDVQAVYHNVANA